MTDRFEASNGFIADFKARHRFSSRRQHLKRRPEHVNDDHSEWIAKLKRKLESKDRRFILNCDETTWYVFPSGVLTWSDTGAEGVSVKMTGNEKENLTVLATVNAAGEKFPLLFVAKGTTHRVEDSQLGDVGPHWKCHTDSGWMQTETFVYYLMCLRELFDDHKVYLLLDQHASHRAEECKTLAKSMGIRLIFIPPGYTDELQPCDRRVFGALKATAKYLWSRREATNPGAKRTKIDAVQDMIAAWDTLSQSAIEEAWDIYVDQS